MSDQTPKVEQIKKLIQVQEIDLRIDQLEKQKNFVPKEVEEIEQKLSLLHREYAQKEKALEEAQKTSNQIQAAVELNQDRLNRTNTKVEGIQNSKEFQAMNREIDQLKKMAESLIEKKETAAKEIESSSKSLEETKIKFEDLKNKKEDQVSKLQSEGKNLSGDLESLKKDRLQHAEGIARSLLRQYDRVRKSREGLGIVPLVGSMCQGCHMTIPPQMANHAVRTEDIIECPSCLRILYVPERKEDSSNA